MMGNSGPMHDSEFIFLMSLSTSAASYTHCSVLPPTPLICVGVDDNTGGDVQGLAQGAAHPAKSPMMRGWNQVPDRPLSPHYCC